MTLVMRKYWHFIYNDLQAINMSMMITWWNTLGYWYCKLIKKFLMYREKLFHCIYNVGSDMIIWNVWYEKSSVYKGCMSVWMGEIQLYCKALWLVDTTKITTVHLSSSLSRKVITSTQSGKSLLRRRLLPRWISKKTLANVYVRCSQKCLAKTGAAIK